MNRTMLELIVTRPKSNATVVVVLPYRWPGSSMPMAAVVIAASVVSGSMSDSAPIAVVLPTPKPPDTTILTGTGGGAAAEPAHGSPADGPPPRGSSERSDTLHQP